MKKISVLAILCIALTLLAGCNFLVKTGTLKGTITDYSTGKPVEGAVVSIWNQVVKTNAAGQYTVKVKAASFTMKVEHPYFNTQTASVTVKADQETVKDLALKYTTVKGIVSDAQGGGPIVGATVTWNSQTVTTDTNGYFEFEMNSEGTDDIIVTKEGRATGRVQDFDMKVLGKFFNRERILEIPLRAKKTPHLSDIAPTLTLEKVNDDNTLVPVTPDMELSKTVKFKQSADSDKAIIIMYAWAGTLQRQDRSLYISDVDAAVWSLNTTLFPNGLTFIRAMAYDENENLVLRFFPVVINNTKDDTEKPGDITILRAAAYSFGKNLGYYSNDKVVGRTYRVPEITLPDGEKFTPNIAAPGAVMYVNLSWNAASKADGYEVYRSIGDDANYKLVGYSRVNSFSDYSAQLKSNTEIYYKVVPYNSFGKGKELVRVAYLLPSFNVLLQTPANEAANVSRTPNFVWKNSASGAFPVDTYFYYRLQLWDSTDYQIWEAEVEPEVNATDTYELQYDQVLQPGAVYSWDVTVGLAFYNDYDDVDGYSVSYSYSGEFFTERIGSSDVVIGTGSVNGEAIFTTQLQ